jgi:hypothetical protein
MKTLLIGFALSLSSWCIAVAQVSKTNFDELAVVPTSTGTAVQLSWKKGDENIAYFIVERSNDGIDFKQCGIVFLSEDPEFTEYKFRDRVSSYSSGLLYRIGIVNSQNRISYLPVKKLKSPRSL